MTNEPDKQETPQKLPAKPLLFPLHVLYNSPGWMEATTLCQGALASILFPWWLAGCPTIDTSKDMDLQESARLTHARWHRNRDYIKQALDKITPKLIPIYKKLLISYHKQYNRAMKANAGSRAYQASMRHKRLSAQANPHEYTSPNNQTTNTNTLKSLGNNGSLVDNSVRAEIGLPANIPPAFQVTPNSFKHKRPKPLGTLRDK
jgi:hypothetical protein